MSDGPVEPTPVDTPTVAASPAGALPAAETGVPAEEATTPSTTKATSSPSAVRRTLKLVLTLQPREPVGYRALVALGTDGCDPLLRSLEVEALATILDTIPTLIAEAEAQWAAQPRYPAAAKGKAPAGKREARPGPE